MRPDKNCYGTERLQMGMNPQPATEKTGNRPANLKSDREGAAVPECSNAKLTLIQLPSSKKAKECYVMIATVRE